MKIGQRIRQRFCKCLRIVIVVFSAIILFSACANHRGKSQETYPTNPPIKINVNEAQVYYDLVNGNQIKDWSTLDGTLEFVKKQYDCADFRLVNLIRILYEYEDSIPSNYKDKIEDVLFNFRYWLDEPGENSMCYWSENHQILFASAEYLIGQKYPNQLFSNSGLTGKEHQEKAKGRILDWLSMRWNYGFSEFYSNVYYKEDIAALINLIDYAEQEEVAKKSAIIMDLLFYDVVTQSSKNMFISVSGRAYERNRKADIDPYFGGINDFLWGNSDQLKAGLTYGLAVTRNYKIPPVFQQIANDSSNAIIKQSNGLNIDELRAEGYLSRNMQSLMMQWGMEAFINPKVVRKSLAYIRDYNLFSNEFLKDFKRMDRAIVRMLFLEPSAMRILNPQETGTAIQRGNTYTYATRDYSIYTVQNYQVGTFADQHHVAGMNIANHFAVFHTHSAVEKNRKSASPNYWVGYGHLPHAVQDKNVNLSIYSLPKKKQSMEKDLLHYTHAYFPKDDFDTTVLIDNYIFGKKEDTYCAFIGLNDFYFRDDSMDDLVQDGRLTFWITEGSSKSEDGNFDHFILRILNNPIDFSENNLILNYQSNGTDYELKYKDEFKVNNAVVEMEYERFNSPYLKANRKSKTFVFHCNGDSLYLDFENNVREY